MYSPVEGKVAFVQSGLPDNSVGTVNYGENWGNHVIIQSDKTPYVAVCHLMAGSVAVQPGQRVSFDTMLGKVGNSGRSAVPHLHLQKQTGAKLGTPNKPFRLGDYFEAELDIDAG